MSSRRGGGNPKGKDVPEINSPKVEQLSHGVADINLGSAHDDGEWEVIARKSKNRAGSSAAKQWGSQNSNSKAWAPPNVQKPSMWTSGGSGRTPGNSWPSQTADSRKPAGRGNVWQQSSTRGFENNSAATQPVIPPPLDNGWNWQSRAGFTQPQGSEDCQGNDKKDSNVAAAADDDDDVDENSDALSDTDDELLSDEFDSDSSEKSHGTRKKSGWFKNFFEILDSLTVGEINDPARQWHCPACQGGPGSIDWYRGLQPLMTHAKTKGSKRVKQHREFGELLDEELRRRGTTVVPAGEAFGKWNGLQDEEKDHEIVWPPMVVIMNTKLEQDDNDKWIGMGNQELLDYFSSYAAVKARHSYGPQGHRGMSILIFESSARGYLEAERLHKHFIEQRTDKYAWHGSGRVLFYPGGNRQLYGYMAMKEDMNSFNQHSQGKSKLKFEMRSYQEMVVNQIRQMSEDNQQLVWLKNKVAKEQRHAKALEESLVIVSEKLRKTTEENRIVRQRTKMQHEENKEEALGDYPRMINDFSVLPSQVREGRVGSYWYHEDTQAFFDDSDHYKMIKAMCKLSCSECDKMEEQPTDGSKRRARFRNIEQLKGHLFHRHRLSMCSLCLEGRKVFICEEKLYTRAQLNQHINTGDSEVDGSESERGGLMGHPMCEFCRTPFYGDNELYSHMSTEHYTCHICQRQHPGQYEYYKNYDDLEMHFRQGHFLCEDESCLAKKFVVFQSEAEMKRHNTIEHGGRMSRSKRNAALQIPTSFRYRRSSEQDHRRGRGRTFRRDSSENQLSMAIQASLETAHADSTFHDLSSSSGQVDPDIGDTSDIDPIINPFVSLTTTDTETSSRYLQALGQNPRSAPLEDSSFPPLSMAPGSSQSKPQHDSDGLPTNTMAAHLRRKNNRKVAVISSGQAWPAARRGPVVPPTDPAQGWPTPNGSPFISRGSGQNKVAFGNGPGSSSYASSAQAQVETRQTTVHGLLSSGSLRDTSNTNSGRISHSASAPNLVENGSVQPSISDFPPVSAAQVRKVPSTSQALLKVGDVQTANKSLVEKIRIALEFDEERYTTFKDISGQYRQGLVETEIYLDFVRHFGLLHLVLDLARLCPDPQKQKELIDAYNASIRSNVVQGNEWSQGSVHLKDGNTSKKGKGKNLEAENSNSKNILADSIISSVRELQSSYRPSEEAVEVLPKDGYRAAKGKSKLAQHQEELNSRSQPLMQLKGQKDPPPTVSESNPNLGDGGGGSKQRKKTSKFHRVRLGDGSAAALLDLRNADPQPDTGNERLDGSSNTTGGLPVHGVWRNKAAHKLF